MTNMRKLTPVLVLLASACVWSAQAADTAEVTQPATATPAPKAATKAAAKATKKAPMPKAKTIAPPPPSVVNQAPAKPAAPKKTTPKKAPAKSAPVKTAPAKATPAKQTTASLTHPVTFDTCLGCHGDFSRPDRFLQMRDLMVVRIQNGEMPPKTNLPVAERQRLIQKIRSSRG
jgi:hypothetical protein